MKKNILKILTILLCVNIITIMVSIIFQDFTDTIVNLIKVTASTILFSIPGLCIANLYNQKKYKTLSLIGMTICALSFIYLLLSIWGLIELCTIFCTDTSNINYKIFLSLLLISLSLAHISLLLTIKNQNKTTKTIKSIIIFISIIFDIILLQFIWDLIISYILFIPLTTILALIIFVGTIITYILSKITSTKEIDNSNYYNNPNNTVMYKDDFEQK